MIRRNNDETSTWISTTDLISGTLVIFLFMAVMLMHKSTEQKNRIEGIVSEAQEAKIDLSNHLIANFSANEIEAYEIGTNLDSDLGKARFKDGVGTFDQGQAVIKPEFKKELDNFLPKYLAAISMCKPDSIKEIRIEGHTSSEWGNENYFTEDEAYIRNMELSQSRTRAILNYAMTMPELAPYRGLMKEKLTANGLSSSHLVIENGKENKEKSRRIEFKVVPNDEQVVENVKHVMNIK